MSHVNGACGVLVSSRCPDQPLVVVEVHNLRRIGEDVTITAYPFLYLSVLHDDWQVVECLVE